MTRSISSSIDWFLKFDNSFDNCLILDFWDIISVFWDIIWNKAIIKPSSDDEILINFFVEFLHEKFAETNEIIEITKSAEEYLFKLIIDKNEVDLSIRIFITDPGTPKAETCLAYCNPDEIITDDIIINLELITVYVEKRSLPFLKDTIVNFDKDNFGGQLTIKAPNARMPNISPDSPIEDRINYIIYFRRCRRL